MRHISVPVKKVDGQDWAELSAHGVSATHILVGEAVRQERDLSFAGGHRVRQFKFKKNVHWRIATGFEVDISDVIPAAPVPARRRGI